MLTLTTRQKETISKSVIAGSILAVSTSILYGNGTTDFVGMSVPAAVPMFIAGAGASLATDLVSSQLKLPTTSSQKIADISTLAISSGISGAAAVIILKSTSALPNEAILPVFGIGLLSQSGSDYIVHRYLEQDGKFVF